MDSHASQGVLGDKASELTLRSGAVGRIVTFHDWPTISHERRGRRQASLVRLELVEFLELLELLEFLEFLEQFERCQLGLECASQVPIFLRRKDSPVRLRRPSSLDVGSG
jgi:hypothetical protein